MRYKFNDGYVLTEEEPLGSGANFVSYRGILINDTFPNGKNVVLKEYIPTKNLINKRYQTINKCIDIRMNNSEIISDEKEIYCKEIMVADKEMFLRQFRTLPLIVNNIKKLQNNELIRDDIVDYYSDDFQLFDEKLKPIENLDMTDYESVRNVKYYRGLSIFYDDNFSPDGILSDVSEIEDILSILIGISEIISRLHKEKLFHRDIKINNFLYKKRNDTFIVKMLDTDSITDQIKSVCSSEPYSPIEAYRGEYYYQSDIYMLGVTLFKMILGKDSDLFTHYSNDERTGEQHKYIIYEDLFSQQNIHLLIEKYHCTRGFLNRLSKIFNKSLANAYRNRYDSVEKFVEDLKVLLDIYNHKGVHPEVMLDRGIALSNNKNFFNEEEFEEKLLCDIEEVN